MNKSAMIRARVDPVLKDEVEGLFEQLGHRSQVKHCSVLSRTSLTGHSTL